MLQQMLSYPFIVNALIVGVLVSLCAALLGVNLVLKNYSMIGDGLSHVGFGALAVATAFGFSPLYVTLPVVMLTAFVLLRLSENGKLKGDAAIALFSTSALSIGVIVSALARGMNADLYSYMFGSILAMTEADVWLSVGISILILILFLWYYHELFLVTFDESFASAIGVRTGFLNTLLAMLTAVVIVLGMRMMGALLISSLIIFPALTAMQVFRSFKHVIWSAAALSVLCFVIGITASFAFALPTGASVVMVNLGAFLIASAIAALRAH